MQLYGVTLGVTLGLPVGKGLGAAVGVTELLYVKCRVNVCVLLEDKLFTDN